MRKIHLCTAFLVLLYILPSCKNQKNIHPAELQAQQWYNTMLEYNNVNFDSIIRYAKLLDSASKNLPVEYQAMSLSGYAIYKGKKQPSVAIRDYQKALSLLSNTSADTLRARIYNGLGICTKNMADYPLALEYFFTSLRLYEKSGDAKSAAGVLSNIGELYQVKGDIPSAKKYILQSMDLNKKNGNTSYYLASAQTLANIYGMNNQFDSALAIDNMGIVAADSIRSNTMKSIFYNNKGNCYLFSNRLDSAAYYFNQCLVLDSAAGSMTYMTDNYLTLGTLSYMKKNYADAEKKFGYAIVLADSLKNNHMKQQAWKGLADVYKSTGNQEAVINAKDSAAAIKDRIINEKSEAKIAELKELYETDKKEQTISLQQQKLNNQRLIITAGIVVFILLALLAWLFYRRYKLKKEKELQQSILQQREEATINILTAEEKERKRIAAELHDGVGQLMTAAWLNLQVMEKQMEGMKDEQQQLLNKTALLVGEGCKEVRQVSHNMMPNALLKKGLVNAIKEFTQQIDRSVISINVQAEGLQAPLDSITETILYRVIQECVNNSIKHATATELDISIDKNSQGISLLIEDNGKGFDTSIINNGADGLGLQNIRSRISFLKGTVHWDSSPGNGTVVAIHLPPQENERPKN
jgi:two-component system, NarL family, sensor kinase